MPGFAGFLFDYIAPQSERSIQIQDARQRWFNQETDAQRSRLQALLGGETNSDVDELIERLRIKRPAVAIQVME